MLRKKNNYQSDLRFGERYRDRTTGVEGTLISLHFYEHGCERGSIRWLNKNGEVIETSFDAPELVHVESGQQAKSKKTGGPARIEGHRKS